MYSHVCVSCVHVVAARNELIVESYAKSCTGCISIYPDQLHQGT